MDRGHIRPRGTGTWEIKYDLRTDPVTGKRITKYKSFKGTKKEASRELTRLLAQIDDGVYADPSKMTVSQYLEHWLTCDIERRLAPSSARRHREICETYIKPRIGSLPIAKLAAIHIEKLEADLQKDGRRDGQGLAPQTVKHCHRTLSQALKHAVSINVLSRNPAMTVKAPKVPDREIAILLKEEISVLLVVARGYNTGVIKWIYEPVLLGLTTGMRRGEILGLRWRDVDLDGAKLTVQQVMDEVRMCEIVDGGEVRSRDITFKAPKTAQSRRAIDLPSATVSALRDLKRRQAETRLKYGLGKDALDLVICEADGSPIKPNKLTKAFEDLVAAAGLTRITFHGLRHTHISHLLMGGTHIKVVSERAGHSNINITLKTYAAFIPTMQADAAKLVDGWLSGAVESASEKPSGGNPVANLPKREGPKS